MVITMTHPQTDTTKTLLKPSITPKLHFYFIPVGWYNTILLAQLKSQLLHEQFYVI